jgi:hypothetical protein
MRSGAWSSGRIAPEPAVRHAVGRRPDGAAPNNPAAERWYRAAVGPACSYGLTCAHRIAHPPTVRMACHALSRIAHHTIVHARKHTGMRAARRCGCGFFEGTVIRDETPRENRPGVSRRKTDFTLRATHTGVDARSPGRPLRFLLM